jgi:hypothetical protein
MQNGADQRGPKLPVSDLCLMQCETFPPCPDILIFLYLFYEQTDKVILMRTPLGRDDFEDREEYWKAALRLIL